MNQRAGCLSSKSPPQKGFLQEGGKSNFLFPGRGLPPSQPFGQPPAKFHASSYPGKLTQSQCSTEPRLPGGLRNWWADLSIIRSAPPTSLHGQAGADTRGSVSGFCPPSPEATQCGRLLPCRREARKGWGPPHRSLGGWDASGCCYTDVA